MPYPRRLLWDILPRNTPNSQNLLLRCPPTDFSLGGYGILPYPRHLLWDILPQNTPNSQNLLLRCPPTDFTDLHRYLGCAVLQQNTEFGSVGMAGMPYPPTSVLICVICGRFFSARSFRVFRAFCGNLFPPTDFTDLHRYLGCAVLPQNSQNTQNLAAWVWQGCHTLLHLCSSVPSVEVLSLQEVLCILCIPWEYLFSHGFHRFTQMLRARFVPTEFTEYTEFGSVGMAGMPYPPTSVSSVGVLSLQEVLCIRCIPWELLHRLFCWCSRDCCTPWRNPQK